MEKKSVEAYLVSKKENRYYYSLFKSTSFHLIITREENYLLTDFRYIEAAGDLEPLYKVVETRNAKGKKVRKLKLPKIKQPIRCYNQGTRLPGRPKVCIISRKDEGTYYSYWASIVCESEDDPKEHPEHPRAVGIDLGLRHLIATSDGHIEDNDHVYWNRLHQLKKESERFSESMHHTTEGRKRRNRLNHLYTKISNIRKNRIENIT